MAERVNIQTNIANLFAEKLNLEVASVETDLVETGLLDSLKFVELLLALEQGFGITIPPADLEVDNFRSIGKIAAFVSSHNGFKQDP